MPPGGRERWPGMVDEVAERIERIFSELMVGETMPVRERTTLLCLAWDSLMHRLLLAAIEQEFQITFSDEELIDLNSFSAALAMVQEKLREKGSSSGPRL